MGQDNFGTDKEAQPAKEPTPADAAEDSQNIHSPNTPRSRCAVVDVAKVDFSVSPKWRKRLKQLDDYQRAAPFVLGRFTLG